MTVEAITFSKGINRKKSPLFLDEGELYSCQNFNLETGGQLESRPEMSAVELIDNDSDSTINGIHRYDNSIVSSSKAYCPGDQAYFNYIYQRSPTGSFDNIDISSGNNRPSLADYEKFIFFVDGEDRKAFIDEKSYDWGVPNPAYPPTLTVGAAGNPDGTYYCYVTFYITFPNDKVVETGPSPVGSVTVSSEKIEWSHIPICEYQGGGLVIHRRLYRTVSGTAYLVTTLEDNTTTTYSDDTTDAALQLLSTLATTGYSTPPDGLVDIDVYLERVFGIKDNKIYWSEAYAPFCFLTTSDIVVTKEEEDLVGVINWGDQLWVVSKEKWRRLQGNDPDEWSIKRTFTETGIINRHTIKKSKYGIMGLWYDGIYLFNGMVSNNITEKYLGRQFFKDINDTSTAYAEFDGQIYSFYYDSAGSGIDGCLKIDFAYYPDLVITTSGFIPTAHEYHKDTDHNYYAYDGYEYEESGTEDISAYFQTGDKSFGDIAKKKNLEYLYYDIDTSGTDVCIYFYVDGVNTHDITLNESSRVRRRSDLLPNLEGYRFSVLVEADDASDVVIYAPWSLSGTPVGD